MVVTGMVVWWLVSVAGVVDVAMIDSTPDWFAAIEVPILVDVDTLGMHVAELEASGINDVMDECRLAHPRWGDAFVDEAVAVERREEKCRGVVLKGVLFLLSRRGVAPVERRGIPLNIAVVSIFVILPSTEKRACIRGSRFF
jgi:hypothetical protein